MVALWSSGCYKSLYSWALYWIDFFETAWINKIATWDCRSCWVDVANSSLWLNLFAADRQPLKASTTYKAREALCRHCIQKLDKPYGCRHTWPIQKSLYLGCNFSRKRDPILHYLSQRLCKAQKSPDVSWSMQYCKRT